MDNDWIIPTDYIESPLKSKDIDIIIRTKKAVAGKPSKPHPTKDKYKGNHFLCTWKSEGYIDELTDEHCLIFNMFGECTKHLLLMTKQQEDQTAPLNSSDFKGALMVQKSLDTFFFYNSGFESGGSKNHKHIQFMPYATFGDQTNIPLEQAAMDYLEKQPVNETMFKLPQFSGFKHVFYKLPEDFWSFSSEDDLDTKSIMIKNYYQLCHQYLDNTDINEEQAYNLVVCKKFLFIALRTTDLFKENENSKGISIGSKAFVGMPYANNEDQLKIITSNGLVKILEKICVPSESQGQ